METVITAGQCLSLTAGWCELRFARAGTGHLERRTCRIAADFGREPDSVRPVLPQPISPSLLSLPSTWQVPALLICALVAGPRAGVIASVAYLTIGLVDLPVFHGGGGLAYLLTPGFGYLAGFIPALLADRTFGAAERHE